VGILRIALALVAVVVAAIAANVALLSLATSNRDPVGRLSPVVALQPAPAQRLSAEPAPSPSEPSEGPDADD
jgi:hypothetical protein